MNTIEDTRPAAQAGRDKHLLYVLQRIWTYAITTKSDLVREYADEVAEAAGRNFITTKVIPCRDLHGRLWKLTPEGTQFLFDNADVIADEEVANYVESIITDE